MRSGQLAALRSGCANRFRMRASCAGAGGPIAGPLGPVPRRRGREMARIVLEGITKQFGPDVIAVDDVSLDIADGEFMVLVGPSGCGKSTILRMIVGLEDITSGDMMIGGVRVNKKAPRDRNLAMVFQNYALYPHLTVFENIAFPLRLRK